MLIFVEALLGGMLIGLSAAILWLGIGRIAGISGVVGELAAPSAAGNRHQPWRWAFLAGLLFGGLLIGVFAPERVLPLAGAGPERVLVAGVLVGVGTRLANGCTSGHGVCGLPRGSTRSVVATALYIGVAIGVVGVMRLLGAA